MTVEILDELLVRVIDDNRNELLADYRVMVREEGQPDYMVTSPAGSITDYASVPRLPAIYLLFGGKGKREAVPHDRLYTTCERPRNWCDAVFHHLLLANPLITRQEADQMYYGVRLGGAGHYGRERAPVPGAAPI